MTARSIAISRGAFGTKISDFTVGTSAPGAGDVEFRYNDTDVNGKNLNREDLKILMDQIWRFIASGQGLQSPAGTFVIPDPFGPPS